jgi:hypothetical protein
MIGDTTATSGYDARWPIRAYRIAQMLANGAKAREALAIEARAFLPRSLIEDTLCAMENDGIVLASAPMGHLTRSERIALLAQEVGGVFVKTILLTLSERGRQFLREHQQAAEAEVCRCCWCTDLAEIRAWAEKQTPEQISFAWLAVAAQIS